VGTDLGSYPTTGYVTSGAEPTSSVTRDKERVHISRSPAAGICVITLSCRIT
jgi:hypothetical protein